MGVPIPENPRRGTTAVRWATIPALGAGSGLDGSVVRMKTIGVLGGMSWESSAQWYRLANESVKARLGGHHSARVLLDSLDFAEIEELQARGDWDAAGELLAEHARRLEAGGADLLVLCTNTMHLVADRIQAAVAIPFLHIVDTVASAIQDSGASTVGLLGTAFTMEQSFSTERLAGHGIRTIVPDPAARTTVHRIIYDELVHGIVREESRERYREVIRALVTDGAQGIILCPRGSGRRISPPGSRRPSVPIVTPARSSLSTPRQLLATRISSPRESVQVCRSRRAMRRSRPSVDPGCGLCERATRRTSPTQASH